MFLKQGPTILTAITRSNIATTVNRQAIKPMLKPYILDPKALGNRTGAESAKTGIDVRIDSRPKVIAQ